LSCSFSSRALSLEAIWPLYLSMSSGVSMLFFSFSEYALGLPRCVKHVILYSDCCTGQNRNQYITAGLLHALQNSGNLETIEQKFLESGHTQMECKTSIIFLCHFL
jgi:hypothetical protein